MDWDTMSGADKREFLVFIASLIVIVVGVGILFAIMIAAVIYAPWYLKIVFVALTMALLLAIASTFYGD